jgi:predicted Zn-dependent peptidase
LIRRELRRISERLIGAEELRRAKDYVAGQIDLGAESTENQMNWIGEQLLGYGRVEDPETVKRLLRRVTAAEVRAVALEFLRPERMRLALVGPVKSAASLETLFWN